MSDNIKITTPRGEAFYPCLNRTNTWKGVDSGKYTCKIVFSGEQLEEMKKLINDALEEAYGPKKAAAVWASDKPPIKTKDGKSFVTFATKAITPDGKPRKVAIFDAKGRMVEREINVGSGSIIKIQGSMSIFAPKDPGVTFYLNAVQVIKLVEYKGGASFEAEDDDDAFDADEFDGAAHEGHEEPMTTHGRGDF